MVLDIGRPIPELYSVYQSTNVTKHVLDRSESRTSEAQFLVTLENST